MNIKLINVKSCPDTGIMVADVLIDDRVETDKTFFPSSWSREQVITKIGEAAKNPIKPCYVEGDWVTFAGATSEGIIIRILINRRSGEYVTAYPDARANCLLSEESK